MNALPRPIYLWLVYFWPGLRALSQQGHWLGLVVAVGFTFVLNLAIVVTWIYPEWIDAHSQILVWSIVALYWFTALGLVWCLSHDSQRGNVNMDDTQLQVALVEEVSLQETLFKQALSAYLSSAWVKAEEDLQQLLKVQPNDFEAKLLLATIYRRMNRIEDARDWLRQLKAQQAELADSEAVTTKHWNEEILNEEKLLAEVAT